jgi:hypothetical protein
LFKIILVGLSESAAAIMCLCASDFELTALTLPESADGTISISIP